MGIKRESITSTAWQTKTCESCKFRGDSDMCRLNPPNVDQNHTFYATIAYINPVAGGNPKKEWYPACSKWSKK